MRKNHFDGGYEDMVKLTSRFQKIKSGKSHQMKLYQTSHIN